MCQCVYIIPLHDVNIYHYCVITGLSVDGPSPQQLCDDRSLLQYIVMRKFELHPCENLRTFVNEQQICEDFTGAFVTSPFEVFDVS